MNDKLREALKRDVRALAHLTPEDWDERRGADPIARTINAVFDIIDARFAAQPSEPGLDEERLRRVFHEEYQRDESGDRYFGCHHVNQHRSTWDCQQRADEFLGEYARLASEPTDEQEGRG